MELLSWSSFKTASDAGPSVAAGDLVSIYDAESTTLSQKAPPTSPAL